MRASYQHMTPFLSGDEADTMLRIAEARGVFGTYADEALNEGLGEQLPQRFDAAFNYINHGIDGQGNVNKGVLSVEINQRFALSEATAAHEALEARKTTGSSLLLP